MDYTGQSSTKSSQGYLPWIIWGLGSLFYFYECLLQVSPSVMSVELMRDFSVTGHTLGILAGIYFYSYAAMQLPGGLLLDYFGPRRLLALAALICGISSIGFAMTSDFFMAGSARLMMGLGSAFAVIGSLKLAANWFNSDRFALLTGLMVTIGMMGAIGGEAPLAYLVDSYGWRESMIFMGSIGIGISLLIALIAKDTPNNTKTLKQHSEPVLTNLKSIVKNKQLWLIATYGGLMYMGTPVFCGLWGVPFLMFKMHIAKATAANYISWIFIGWAVTSPLWGILSNRIGLRKPPMYIGSIGALIVSVLFIYAPIQSPIVMQALLCLFGVFSAGFLPAFSVAKELCSKDYVATGLSFMNMMNMIGIAISEPLIGFILDTLWDGTLSNGIRLYPSAAYHTALSILPIGILVSLFILIWVRETHCVASDSN